MSSSPLIVVKIGGEVLADPGVTTAVATDLAAAAAKARVIAIHGGGPQATDLQRRLGQKPHIVAGRRITDQAALDVMKMVVGGSLNIDLCAALLAAGARPVGLHGASSWAIEGTKRPPRVVAGGGADPIDFGWVGDVVGVNEPLLALLLASGYLPVLACLAADRDGRVLNINGDVVANQVAVALGAEHLVVITGTPGVLRDPRDPSSRFSCLTVAEARARIHDGTVSGGMIPKLDESIAGLESGAIGSVHIVGRVRTGDLLRELAQPGSVGTALRRE